MIVTLVCSMLLRLSAQRIETALKNERVRNNALQLETLTEFVEHHLQVESMSGVSLLVDALLATEKAGKKSSLCSISWLVAVNDYLLTAHFRVAVRLVNFGIIID
jgi:hypothetical protein